MRSHHDALVTETAHPSSERLGEMSATQVVRLMSAEERRVVAAVTAVGPQLAEAAENVAQAFLSGGRTVLLGAGTSGRIAIQEVSELPPTFGVRAEQFCAFVASRAPVGPAAVAPNEDDTTCVAEALHKAGIGRGDVVIGLAASGHTPFVVSGVAVARNAGAWTCGIANNPGTPLLERPHLGILLDTGPELLTGSTRLKAGTAQKVALNQITTAAMAVAGRIHGNYMIEMRATNSKLRARAVRMVAEILGVPAQNAENRLVAADWHVGDAIRAHRT